MTGSESAPSLLLEQQKQQLPPRPQRFPPERKEYRPSLKGQLEALPTGTGAPPPKEGDLSTEAARKVAVEEYEKQKQRLAAKMEMVNFYGGCCSAFGKMTAAQNKELIRKLRTADGKEEELGAVVGQFGQEREAQIQNWVKKKAAQDAKGTNPRTVKRGLSRLSDFCGGTEKAPALPLP